MTHDQHLQAATKKLPGGAILFTASDTASAGLRQATGGIKFCACRSQSEQAMNVPKSVKYPASLADIRFVWLVKSVNIDNGEVKVQLALATNDPNVPATIKNDAEKALCAIDGVRSAKVLIDIHAPPAAARELAWAPREFRESSTSSRWRAARAVSANRLWRPISRSRFEQTEARVGLV